MQYNKGTNHHHIILLFFSIVVGVISIYWGSATITMHKRYITYTTISILFFLPLIIYLNINTIIRLLIIKAIQKKYAFTSSGSQISIDSVSLTFGCSSRNKKIVSGSSTSEEGGGYTTRYSSRREERSCWNLELNHIHITNSASYTAKSVTTNKKEDNDDYQAPYSLHLKTLRISLSGPFAVLSLLQLPIATTDFFGMSSSLPRLYCNGLDFFIGFRVRSIDTLDISGLSVFYVEDGGDDGERCGRGG